MSSNVYSLESDGRNIFAGGTFTSAYDGAPTTRIAKWNGSIWSALGTGMNNTVHALEWSGSSLFAGGSFSLAGGKAARVARADNLSFTLTLINNGNGTTTSSPAGINCAPSTSCSFTYPSETTVELTHNADSGYEFSSWSGDCSGNGSCVVTMDQTRSVTATFLEEPDTDGDGVVDSQDPWPTDSRYYTDSDSDGLADEWENFNFGDLTSASGASDMDNDGFSDLTEFQNGEDPTKGETTRTEAQRRIPPMVETLVIPEQMNADGNYTLDWKVLGYDDSYTVTMAMFDCTGIVDGSCGDSYGDANRFHSVTLTPHTIESAPWTYSGEVAEYFHYQTSFTVPSLRYTTDAWSSSGTPVAIRFYQKNSIDAAAGKNSISLLVPGNITDVYYDSTGRRIQKTICPVGGCL